MQNDLPIVPENLLWISVNDRLPDKCCVCGMFTDQRVPAVYSEVTVRQVPEGSASTLIALGCLLHLLGPIGWILGWFLSGESNSKTKSKRVVRKYRIKVPQCQLCSAQQKPDPLSMQKNPLRMEMIVHPAFRRAYEEANREE